MENGAPCAKYLSPLGKKFSSFSEISQYFSSKNYSVPKHLFRYVECDSLCSNLTFLLSRFEIDEESESEEEDLVDSEEEEEDEEEEEGVVAKRARLTDLDSQRTLVTSPRSLIPSSTSPLA